MKSPYMVFSYVADFLLTAKDFKTCYPLLEVPENGERTPITVDGFIKYISFSCNPNYVLRGESLARCINGTWTSSTPVCLKISS